MKSKRGFTLIELLVVTVIFGILLIVGTNLFFQVVLSANKASTDADLRQNASLVIERISRDVRGSSCLNITNGSKDLNLYQSSDCSGTAIVYRLGNNVTVGPPGQTVLSTPKANFSNSTFSDTNPTSNGKAVVVTLVVSASGDRYDFQGQITETQTISVRNGNF